MNVKVLFAAVMLLVFVGVLLGCLAYHYIHKCDALEMQLEVYKETLRNYKTTVNSQHDDYLNLVHDYREIAEGWKKYARIYNNTDASDRNIGD
jgi:uncharacterized membrane-anchored protein YhcB (DUF1043 family)